jgi:hypothetical protein
MSRATAPGTGPVRRPLDGRNEYCKLLGETECNETQRFR